jgi:hypothetical protein
MLKALSNLTDQALEREFREQGPGSSSVLVVLDFSKGAGY